MSVFPLSSSSPRDICIPTSFVSLLTISLFTDAPEVFPTPHRGTGDAIAAATGRIFGLFAPIIAGSFESTFSFARRLTFLTLQSTLPLLRLLMDRYSQRTPSAASRLGSLADVSSIQGCDFHRYGILDAGAARRDERKDCVVEGELSCRGLGFIVYSE